MAGIWTGSNLITRYCEKYGFRGTNAQTRVGEWITEIQEDICACHNWASLKFRLKKYVASGTQEVDISPEIPSAPTVAVAAGGSLTASTAYYVKVTFLLFGEDAREYSSLESEPSAVSAVATTTVTDKQIDLTSIPLYSGSTNVRPTTIHRRVYLRTGTTGFFAHHSTITNNTATTLSITTNTTSVIEPPEYSLVQNMTDEDPYIEANGVTLSKESLDNILKYDPNLSTTGTPQSYARLTKTKIFLYPRPSDNITLSYWVKRIPARVFNDSDRIIQLDHDLKKVLDEGVDWKGKAWKQDSQASEILSNYEAMKLDAIGNKGDVGGVFSTVKVVC